MQTITINGETHHWRLTARALKKLGVSGFGDAEGLSRMTTAAVADFDKLVEIVSAGIPNVSIEAVREAVMDWTAQDMSEFFDTGAGPADANPPRAESVSGSTGSEPGLSVDTISA